MKFNIATKIFLFIVFLIFVLVATIFIVPIYFKDQIRDEIISEINKKIDAQVSFSDFDITIYSEFPDLTIDINNLYIVGKNEFQKDTLLSVKELKLTMDIQEYYKKHEIHFLNLTLQNSHLNCILDKNGNTNYAILKSDSSNKTSDTNTNFYNIENISLKNSRISFKDEIQKLNLQIDGLDHEASWQMNKVIFDWKTHTKINYLTYDHDGIKYINNKETEVDMILEVNTAKSLFTFKENNIRINHFNFKLEGNIAMNQNVYNLDFKFEAKETLFKHLISLLPGMYMEDLKSIKTEGDVAFDGFVKGTYNVSLGQIPAFHVNMKVKDALFKYDSLPLPIEHINFHLIADNPDGNLKNTVLDLKSFKLKMDKNSIDGHLRIDGIENSNLEGEIKARIDLDDLDKIYPIQELEMQGIVNIDMKTKGNYNKKLKHFPTIDAQIDLINGYLKSTNHPEPLKEIHFSAEIMNNSGNIKDTKAKIEKCTFQLENEPFGITGSVSDFENYTYNLDTNGKLDLTKLTKIYPIDNFNINGIIDIDLESNGKLSDLENNSYENINTNGKISISNLIASGNALPQSIHIDSALLNFTSSKIILEKWIGKLGKSNVTMKGELYDYMYFITHKDDRVSGDLMLECDTLNINDWFQNSEKSDSSNNISTIEIPADVNFTFDSDIKCLLYDDMKMTDLKGEIRVKDKILTLNETGFNSLGALFTLSGDYNSTDSRNTFFDFNLNIKELDINKAYNEVKLIRQFAPVAKDAFGKLSIDYHLKSNLNSAMQPILESMEGGGNIRIHEARLEGMKIMNEISKQSKKSKIKDPTLQDVVMNTEIHGTKLLVKPFALKFSEFDTEIQGTSEISGKIDFHVKVSMLPFERIKLPFHITGTYDKTKISLGKGKAIE